MRVESKTTESSVDIDVAANRSDIAVSVSSDGGYSATTAYVPLDEFLTKLGKEVDAVILTDLPEVREVHETRFFAGGVPYDVDSLEEEEADLRRRAAVVARMRVIAEAKAEEERERATRRDILAARLLEARHPNGVKAALAGTTLEVWRRVADAALEFQAES